MQCACEIFQRAVAKDRYFFVGASSGCGCVRYCRPVHPVGGCVHVGMWHTWLVYDVMIGHRGWCMDTGFL